MRKLLLLIAPVLGLLTVSCEDSLSPKAEFKQEYALYGVINVDTTFQAVYLSRSYQVDGFDGMQNTTDPALSGANVKLEVLSIVYNSAARRSDTTITATYNFQESTAPREDLSRYTTPFKYYSINNYKPADGQNIRITANLNNGTVLSSSSVIPPITYLYYETSTVLYDPLDQEGGGFRGIKFSWRFLSTQYNISTQYFAPRLEVTYHKADNPANKIKVKIPYYFTPQGGSYLPLYPNVSTATSALFYGDGIERALAAISAGDENKGNYVIDGAEFILLLVDKNLASFVAAENTYQDEFSTRIDAADFSNITGGLGMFGASASKRSYVKIASSYIKTFGYKTSY